MMLLLRGCCKRPCFSKSREATILLLTPDDRRESGDSSAKPTNESRRDDVDKAALHRLFETQSYVCPYIPQTPGGRLGLTIMSSLRDFRCCCRFSLIAYRLLLPFPIAGVVHEDFFAEEGGVEAEVDFGCGY